MILRFAQRQAGALREARDHLAGKALRRVDAGADRGAAQRQHAQTRQRVTQARDPVVDLRRVPTELLAERHRRRIHEVRAARLHHVGELALLLAQRAHQLLRRGDELVGNRDRGREVDRRGKHVVRRLRRVHMVVRVDRCRITEAGRRQARDHLVRVHVRTRCPSRSGMRRSGTRRDGIRGGDLVGRGRDRVGDPPVDLRNLRETCVHPRGLGLDQREGTDHPLVHRAARDREVLDGALRLRAPQRVDGYPHVAHRIVLDAVLGHRTSR